MDKRNANYGNGVVSLYGNTADEVHGNTALLEIRRVLRDKKFQPPMLPRIAIELVRLSQRPMTVDFARDVEPLFAQEPVLTAQLLRRANSSAYGGRNPIRTIRQAVTRLGIRGLRDMVLTLTLKSRIFRSPGFETELAALFQHSTSLAVACESVARYTAQDESQAYLTGLMADLGLAIGILALGVCDRKYTTDEALPALVEIHEEAGAMAVGRWRLPGELQLIIGNHHELLLNGTPNPMVGVVMLAEEMLYQAGAHIQLLRPGIPWPVLINDADRAQAMAILNVGPKQIELARARMLAKLETMQAA